MQYRNRDDIDAPCLEKELKKFKGEIKERFEAGLVGWSCITEYGLEKIYNALLDRIYWDDRPVTLLWHHSGGYSSDHNHSPTSQLNGDKPVNGQKSGYIKNSESPQRPYFKWVSYAKKRVLVNGEKKHINLEDGELLSNADLDEYSGYWECLPHYMKESSEINCYPGEVKKAILASPLSNAKKENLLMELYIRNCPVKKIDSLYSNMVKNLCRDVKDETKDINELNKKRTSIERQLNNKEVPEFIRENLLSNLESSFENYS